ncbi:MAG: ATP-binding protein [Cyanobacteria bacterium P01_G01_bin.54]
MIKYFTVENYKSIKDECILEFDAHLGKDSPFIASPVVGFAGANASGKTTILGAITFVIWFMKSSFFDLKKEDLIPYEKFISLQAKPTRFHLIFSMPIIFRDTQKEVDFEYILVLNQEQVLEEHVNFYPLRHKRKIYIRNLDTIKFGKSIVKLRSEETRDLRRNSSLISFLSLFRSQDIAVACVHYNLISNVNERGLNEEFFDPIARIMEYFSSDAQKGNTLKSVLNLADLGIRDFGFRELFLEEIRNSSPNTLNSSRQDEFDANEGKKIVESQRDIVKDVVRYQIGEQMNMTSDPDLSLKLPVFFHNIDGLKVKLPVDKTWESSGTLKLISLFERIHLALSKGIPIIVDEIELKLHQDLIAYLIGLFQNPEKNPHGAQLIFSFHNSSFMEILEPQQLWFTEKNDQGQTEIFSAADFKDIKQIHKKNLEKLYRIGRFGAKPRGL